MVCKNRCIYGFLGPSWVLITYNICPPVIGTRYQYQMVDEPPPSVSFVSVPPSRLPWCRLVGYGGGIGGSARCVLRIERQMCIYYTSNYEYVFAILTLFLPNMQHTLTLLTVCESLYWHPYITLTANRPKRTSAAIEMCSASTGTRYVRFQCELSLIHI